jgi:uncharacterized membrane protein YhaH (DUF805 family)
MRLFDPKSIRSSIFWLAGTVYLLISFAAMLVTTGGYSFLKFLFFVFPVYLLVWLILTIVSLSSRRLHYSRPFLYAVLFSVPFTILFNIADSGYYGITCDTKNFIQSFFDHSPNCTKLWVEPATYQIILGIYIILLLIFTMDVAVRRLNRTNTE